jgi:tRNA(Ile)-lysidine synthase
VLATTEGLEPAALARSAGHLAEADAAADWAARIEWSRTVSGNGEALSYRPSDAPPEVVRRVVAQAISQIGTEGDASELRGSELDRLLAALAAGGTATLRGVLCTGGPEWRFTRAPVRRG